MDNCIIITNILRLSDGLPLVSGQEPSSQDSKMRYQKQHLKKIVNSLTKSQANKDSEVVVPISEEVYVLYLISEERNIIYCGIFEKSYAHHMASAYLSELKKEFEKVFKKIYTIFFFFFFLFFFFFFSFLF